MSKKWVNNKWDCAVYRDEVVGFVELSTQFDFDHQKYLIHVSWSAESKENWLGVLISNAMIQ